MDEKWVNRFKRPFHSAWMDYCAPYHCNDYHKEACGFDERSGRYKRFQSGCHIELNNLCSTYLGTPQYQQVDLKYCFQHIMFLRSCPAACPDKLDPICSVSRLDNQIAMFINKCAMEKANCRNKSGVQFITNTSFHETTLSQKERIKVLKQKITEQIQSKTSNTEPLDVEDSSIEIVDYELRENENLPITPILKQTRVLTTVKFDSKKGGSVKDTKQDGATDANKGNISFRQLRSEKRQKRIRNRRMRIKNPLEIFYRRGIYKKEMSGQHWVHCQDIITPFLTGAKLNISSPKVLGPKDPTVLRLFSLLKVNTSSYGREDIYAILYQISNLNLRFFRWDVDSIKMLFNIIIKDRKHTFGSLKAGLRDMFNNWRLDFSNTTSLLKQSRIFRPPCIDGATGDGSTKSPKSTKYPKKLHLTPTTRCDEDYDEDC